MTNKIEHIYGSTVCMLVQIIELVNIIKFMVFEEDMEVNRPKQSFLL